MGKQFATWRIHVFVFYYHINPTSPHPPSLPPLLSPPPLPCLRNNWVTTPTLFSTMHQLDVPPRRPPTATQSFLYRQSYVMVSANMHCHESEIYPIQVSVQSSFLSSPVHLQSGLPLFEVVSRVGFGWGCFWLRFRFSSRSWLRLSGWGFIRVGSSQGSKEFQWEIHKACMTQALGHCASNQTEIQCIKYAWVVVHVWIYTEEWEVSWHLAAVTDPEATLCIQVWAFAVVILHHAVCLYGQQCARVLMALTMYSLYM